MEYGYDVRIDGQDYTGGFRDAREASRLEQNGVLQILLEKELGNITLRLYSETDTETRVTLRRLETVNRTDHTILLQHAHISYDVPFPYGRLAYFTSDWGSEYSPVNLDITYPVTIGTWSGRSSKGCSTFFCVTPVVGGSGALGISIGWSGNWQADCRRLDGKNRITVGLAKADFSTTILPGGAFENIDLYDCYDPADSPEEISFRFRSYFKRRIRLLPDSLKALPVCYNPWWPYEDKWIDSAIFLENTIIAGEIGCTNSVLDAGWFGPSEQPGASEDMPWFSKRGDWHRENTFLFPGGIKTLEKRVAEETGLPFGIWCEIEAVGSNSELARERPELLARRGGKPLDYICMGNPESVEFAHTVMKRIIEDYNAKWVKIDFNLDPVSCDCVEHRHGPEDGLYAHYRGLYRFLEEVRTRYPDVILENCASGGLRADYGIMRHCHVMFLSDPDYTRHHLQCYWGALSHFHPSVCYHFTQSETVCDHNFSWNSAGSRFCVYTPIKEDTAPETLDYMVRAAMCGIWGISQKLNCLPDWALVRLREHITFYRAISGDFILRGDVYRLTGQTCSQFGVGEVWCAFQFVSAERGSLIFALKSEGREASKVIQPRALLPELFYTVYNHNDGKSRRMTGYELMNTGICLKATRNVWSNLLEIALAKEDSR